MEWNLALNAKGQEQFRKTQRAYKIKVARELKGKPQGLYQLYPSQVKNKVRPAEVEISHLADDDKEFSTCLNAYSLTVVTCENPESIPKAKSSLRSQSRKHSQ